MFSKRFPLSERKRTRHSPRAVCAVCGKYGYINAYCGSDAVCDDCDRLGTTWKDDRDAAGFDAATERAQGIS